MSVKDAIGRATHRSRQPVEPAPRWLAYAFVACSLALIPWTVWLYPTLPSRATADNWDVAWAGFDLALAADAAPDRGRSPAPVGMDPGRSGVGSHAACLRHLVRRDDLANRPRARVALTMALVAEAPLAILCVWVARNSERVSAWAESLRAAAPGDAASPDRLIPDQAAASDTRRDA